MKTFFVSLALWQKIAAIAAAVLLLGGGSTAVALTVNESSLAASNSTTTEQSMPVMSPVPTAPSPVEATSTATPSTAEEKPAEETAPPASTTDEGASSYRSDGDYQAPPPPVPAPPLPPAPPKPPIPHIKGVGITANAAACPERPDLGFSSFQIIVHVNPDAGAVSADGYLGNLHKGHVYLYENGLGHGDVWYSDYTVGPGEHGQQSILVRVFNSVGEAAEMTGYFNVAC